MITARHHQRRFHLRWQAVLPRNDELRGGEVLPQYLWRPLPEWEQGRRTVRDAMPVSVGYHSGFQPDRALPIVMRVPFDCRYGHP
jgi:carotenoid cleavage dioxygenase-like enzyme